MSIKKIKKLLTTYKTGKEIMKFSNIEVEKHEFDQRKSPILIVKVNINKIIVSQKFPFGKKAF